MCCFLDLKPRHRVQAGKTGQQGGNNQTTHNRNRHRTKKILRDNGIIASTAASAVNTIGRKRRMVAPITASHGSCLPECPAQSGQSGSARLRMIIPDKNNCP